MTSISTPNLGVFRAGRGRVRIRGARADAAETHALIRWLEAQADVKRVEYRERTEEITVTYREAEARNGAFVRSLSDRVYALSTPTGNATMRAEVTHALDGRVRFRLAGVTADEVVRIARWLAELPGVLRANASPAAPSVLVLFDPTVTSTESLTKALSASDPSSWPEPDSPPARAGFGASVGTALVLGAAVSGVVPPAAVALGVAITSIPAARRAAQAAREKRLSVDVLDLAAIGISLATGELVTAAGVTMLLSLGDRIVERTSDSARGAISKLMQLDAKEAFRLEGEDVVRISSDDLAVGDRIVIDAGGRVAADGIVQSGLASVDEKALTGESLPRTKCAGERVLAATVVLEGQIVVEVDRVGGDTTASKIVRILEGAGAKPMTLQRATERITDRLVVPTIGIAATAAAISGHVARATSVLITDFGTGVRIAIPTSALTGLTLAAQNGVLVKGAQYLERLAQADTVVFDKTGTLTCGQPQVLGIATVGRYEEDALLALSAGAEGRQSHPIAEALRQHAIKRGLAIPEPELGTESVVVGYGLSARVEGREVHVGSARWMVRQGLDIAPLGGALERARASAVSSLVVAVDGRIEGAIAYSDAPRPESVAVVRRLRDGGRRKVVLLSGDAWASVDAVARLVEVDEAHGELLPEDKAAYVKKLQDEGHIVAMVGDGINDAPALALSDVGISLDGGTDVALETADVVLLEGGLERLPFVFDLGASTMRSVKRGLGLVLVPNAIGIALGALGWMNPAVAAVVNNGSTVLAAVVAAAPLVTRPFTRA